MAGWKIRLPKLRIGGGPLQDMERLSRTLGLSALVEEPAIESAAQELAKGSLPSWELKALARVATRAAQIKEATK